MAKSAKNGAVIIVSASCIRRKINDSIFAFCDAGIDLERVYREAVGDILG